MFSFNSINRLVVLSTIAGTLARSMSLACTLACSVATGMQYITEHVDKSHSLVYGQENSSLRSWRYCWVARAQAKAAKPRQRAAQPRVAWGGEAEIPPARMGCFFGFRPLICILTN